MSLLATTYLSATEVAARLGVSERTLARLRKTGQGPEFVKFGSTRSAPVRYPEAAVSVWLRNRTQAAGDAR